MSKKEAVVKLCFYCGLPEKNVSPDQFVKSGGRVSQEFMDKPCKRCARFMKGKVLIVEIDDGEAGKANPIRTGRSVTIAPEQFVKLFKDIAVADFFTMERKLFETVFGGEFNKKKKIRELDNE